MRRRAKLAIVGLRAVDGAQGGIETHVRELIGHLPASVRPIEVVVRSPYHQEDAARAAADPDIRFVPIWSPRSQALEALVHTLLSALYLGVSRPEVVHVHAVGPALLAPLLRLLGLKVVFTHHGRDYEREKWGGFARGVLKFGERLGVRFSNKRICIAKILSSELAEEYGQEFIYIPNGVPRPDLSKLGALPQGVEPGKYILHVGRIVPEKRQLELIGAFRKAKMNGVKLVLVGDADHTSDYAREVIAAAADDPDIIMTGKLYGGNLYAVFQNALLFALPSSHEGLPIALLEAMSFNLPLLLSDIPALRTLDLPSGVYFPVNEFDAFAQALETNVARAKEVPRESWEGFLKQYSWEQIGERTAAVYEECAANV